MSPKNVEIERKYLVEEGVHSVLDDGRGIVQGFLPTADTSSVRVRLVPSQQHYTLTFKGPRAGSVRREIEEPISSELAEGLLGACGNRVIEKTRYNHIASDGRLWVVDVFGAQNVGLLLAEIELDRVNETYEVPDWIGPEVTEDERYYNEYLADHPYEMWSK